MILTTITFASRQIECSKDDSNFCDQYSHRNQQCNFTDGSLETAIIDNQYARECNIDTEATEVKSIEEKTLDGTTVVVTGHLPNGAKILVSKITENDLLGILEKIDASNSIFAYDISVIDSDGNEWQPDEAEVTVSISGIDLPKDKKIEVMHISDVDEPEQVKNHYNDSEISFVTDGFSVFIGYTVDFHYEGLTYSITGNGSVLLSEMFNELDIDEDLFDIKSVAFSNESLIKIERQGNDWLLTSIAPFTTKEQLIITFESGFEINIETTDAQFGGNTYVQFWFDTDSSIPNQQQFEYTIQYTGLDFSYDINTKQTTVLTNTPPTAINKTITIAAGSRVPIYVLDGTNHLKIHETPIPDVQTFVQMGSSAMIETHDAMIGYESSPGVFLWAYGDGGAICYKHTSDSSSGKITIHKEVTGNAPAGQSYQFSVIRHIGSYKWVEEIVTVPAGQTSVEIPYTHTTEYGASPQIWIAELNTPPNATASFNVNGSAVSYQTRSLHGRFLQDVCDYDNTKLQRYEALKWVLIDTDSSQPRISVDCTNAFPSNSNLTISKIVTGVIDNTTQFSFELSATNQNNSISFYGKTLPSGVNLKPNSTNILTFNLKNGQSININNLIPQGSMVTLTEVSHGNYTVAMSKSGSTHNGDSWRFLLDSDSTINVTNTAIPVGDINCKKVVAGGTSSDSFPMQLTIVDVSGKIDFTDTAFYGRATIPAGMTKTSASKNSISFIFTLAHNEQVTIENLVPDGAQVTISETVQNNYDPSINVGSSSQQGSTYTFSVSGTDTTNVEVVNTVKSVDYELPFTGGIGVNNIYMYGVILISGSIIYAYSPKIKNKFHKAGS